MVFLIVAPAWQEACSYRRVPNRTPPPLYAFFFPLRWEMFSNGGLHSKETWKYEITNGAHQQVDLSDFAQPLLPPTWRSRFYMEQVRDQSHYPFFIPAFARGLPSPPPIPDKGPRFSRHAVLFSYLREAERLYLQQNPQDSILERKIIYNDGLHLLP
jgi:hypothetical protein